MRARQLLRQGFSLIELLVVITILMLLMALIIAVVPSGEQHATLSRIANIQMAVESYHEHFQAYPRSYHRTSDDTGWKDPKDTSGTTVVSGTMAAMLTTKNLQRRDRKYIDQMYVYNDKAVELSEDSDGDSNKLYFVDGWGNKFVYFSGAEIHEAVSTDATKSTYVMAAWMHATGALTVPSGTTFNPANYPGDHNPNDYYFLISAGEDEVFYYDVLPKAYSDRYNPNLYDPADASNEITDSGADLDGPINVNSDAEDYDDMTNYNLRK